MIGIVVVTHGDIGKEMIAATRCIIPETTALLSVSIGFEDPPEQSRESVARALRELQSLGAEDVLLATDMFGGTPSNVCLSFLKHEKIEVIAGVNLPMLLKLVTMKKDKSIAQLVHFIQAYGQRNIVVARHILGGGRG